MTTLEARLLRIEQMLNLAPVEDVDRDFLRTLLDGGTGPNTAHDIARQAKIDSDFDENMRQAEGEK